LRKDGVVGIDAESVSDESGPNNMKTERLRAATGFRLASAPGNAINDNRRK